MADRQLIDRVLCDVAQAIDAEAVVGYDDEIEVSWELILRSGRPVDVALDEAGDRLVFSTNVGVPPADSAARFYLRLLQYNHLWRETSGAWMATDDSGGEVTMFYGVPLVGLNAELLRNIVENYQAAADAWQLVIAAPREGGDSTDMGNDQLLRV